MFHFGSAEDSAKLYINSALSVTGPQLPDVHYDEMSEADLKNALAYLHLATTRAAQDGASDSVVSYLVKEHDEVLQVLLAVSESTRKWVASPAYNPPAGRSPKETARYAEMAASAN